MFKNRHVFAESSQILYKMNTFKIEIPDPEFDRDRRSKALFALAKVTLVITGLEKQRFRWYRELSFVLDHLRQNDEVAELTIDLRFEENWQFQYGEIDHVQGILSEFDCVQVSHIVSFHSTVVDHFGNYPHGTQEIWRDQSLREETPGFFNFLLGLVKVMLKESGKPTLVEQADIDLEYERDSLRERRMDELRELGCW